MKERPRRAPGWQQRRAKCEQGLLAGKPRPQVEDHNMRSREKQQMRAEEQIMSDLRHGFDGVDRERNEDCRDQAVAEAQSQGGEGHQQSSMKDTRRGRQIMVELATSDQSNSVVKKTISQRRCMAGKRRADGATGAGFNPAAAGRGR